MGRRASTDPRGRSAVVDRRGIGALRSRAARGYGRIRGAADLARPPPRSAGPARARRCATQSRDADTHGHPVLLRRAARSRRGCRDGECEGARREHHRRSAAVRAVGHRLVHRRDAGDAIGRNPHRLRARAPARRADSRAPGIDSGRRQRRRAGRGATDRRRHDRPHRGQRLRHGRRGRAAGNRHRGVRLAGDCTRGRERRRRRRGRRAGRPRRPDSRVPAWRRRGRLRVADRIRTDPVAEARCAARKSPISGHAARG